MNMNVINKYIKILSFVFIFISIFINHAVNARDLTLLPPNIDYKNKCIEKKRLSVDNFDWSKWYPKSTALTDKELFERAELYFFGSVTTPQNLKLSLKIINHLSSKDSKYKGRALKIKVRMLIDGKGVAQDTEKAKALLEYIIEKYDRKMVASLAHIYQDEGNYFKAVDLYKQAVIYGVPSAALALAYLYNDERVPASQDSIERMLTYAQNLVLERIAKGDCKALFNMGSMYLRMDKMVNHEALAVKWYEAAAKLNYVNAKMWLATLANRGTIVEFNREKVLKLWNEAAELGSDSAMYYLGQHYISKKDFDLAYSWLEKAADRNNINAIESLINLYKGNFGSKPDEDKYFYYLKRAENHKNVDSKTLYLLAYLYEQGVQNKKPELKKSFALYQLAAKEGSTDAIFKLGEAYRYGIGINRQPVRALRFYRLAFERGDYHAGKAMQKTYKCGIGKDIDIKKATLWKDRAFYSGTSEAISRAEILLSTGSKEDIKQAITLLKKVISLKKKPKAMALLSLYYESINNKEQMNKWRKMALDADIRENKSYEVHFTLGEAYLYGDLVKKDVNKGLNYLLKATKVRNKYAYYTLANWYQRRGNINKSINLFKKSIEQNHIQSMVDLSDIYRKKHSTYKAAQMLKKAAQYRSVDAMFKLSEAYNTNGWIKPTNLEQSQFWLNKAINNYPCNVSEIVKIANTYNNIYGNNDIKTKEWLNKLGKLRPVETKDKYLVAISLLDNKNAMGKEKKLEAIEMLHSSADKGYQQSIIYLANLYLNSYEDIIPKNLPVAIKLLEKSAQQGNVSSMIELSNFYASGLAGETSFEETKKWLEKAAKLGNEQAINRLKWLNNKNKE